MDHAPVSSSSVPRVLTEPLLHLVLDRPRIFHNVGAVVRLAANVGAMVHICGPFEPAWRDGLRSSQKRSGLDYWRHASLHLHASLDACLTTLGRAPVVVEVDGAVSYSDIAYSRGEVVVFGPESGSVDPAVVGRARVALPTLERVRSLNLSQCAAAVAFEALRQIREADGLNAASPRRGCHSPSSVTRTPGHR